MGVSRQSFWQSLPATLLVASMCGSCAPAVAQAPAFDWPEPVGWGVNLTPDAAAQWHPAISGTRVVWEDFATTDGFSRVMLYDLSAQEPPRAITLYGRNCREPVIDGQRVVYRRHADGFVTHLLAYDIPTGIESLVAVRSSDVYNLALSGNRLAWQEQVDGNWDIYLFDFTSWQLTRITNDPAPQGAPDLDDEVLVWLDGRHGGRFHDVYLRDLRSGNEMRITQSTAVWGPAVSAGTVAWADERGACCWSLYVYDLGTGTERAVPSSPLAEELDLATPWLFFTSRDPNTAGDDTDVLAVNVKTGEEKRLTSSERDESTPAIAGTLVVWSDFDFSGPRGDIYVEDLLRVRPPWPDGR